MRVSTIRAYIDLMKLRVVELLIITTVPAVVLAERGFPSLSLLAWTLIGGTLAAGSANAFNMVIESERDKLMKRTAKRPLVTGAVSRTQATVFAISIGVLSLLIFWFFTTPLATLLTAIAIAYYVIIYTIALKPNTSQNIVWGGAAGCMPVLIGWAAVTNSLTLVPIAFFMVIFFWTPPHFWALAIKYKEDYSRAKVPMLPVVAAEKIVTQQMLGHAIAMILSSLALGIVAELPWWYFATSVLLGGYFLFLVWQLRSVDEHRRGKIAERIFHGSISYLSVISLVIVLAVLI